MFFKATVLKRMLKAAYKGAGLTVGHSAAGEDGGEPEGLYISSGWWVIWFVYDKIPKEAKAAIIEICGDLPDNTFYKRRKGREPRHRSFGNLYGPDISGRDQLRRRRI